jgi:poly(3-hydroxybutyrate) depolymerase
MAALAMPLLAGQTAHAEVLQKMKTIKGIPLHYVVVLPNGFDPAKTYPGVLAFSGGLQTMDTVERTLESNWKDEAEKRGYIVVLPVAPGRLFFQGGEEVFPDFLDQLLTEYKILGNKFHIAGVSNGGISAFHVAEMYPDYFLSITVFPGFLPNPSTASINRLSKMCINMYAGADDIEWVVEMQRQAAAFQKQGLTAQITIEPGQTHRVTSLEGRGAGQIFKGLEAAQRGCGK